MQHIDQSFAEILSGIRLIPDDPDRDARERHQQLLPVLEQLPRSARNAPRTEVEQRIRNRRLLAAANGWRWGSGSLVLAGATGVGKTTSAAHLVRRLCAEAARHGGESFECARFIRWQECRTLSRAYREAKLGTGAPEEIVRCQNARLLVLDDLGKSDDREALEVILQARNQRAWPTVTTTGIGVAELAKFLGQALTRRLFECGADSGAAVDTEEQL